MMAAPSTSSTGTLLVTPSKVGDNWGRPRRQTDPYHRSTTLTSATGNGPSEARRSLDSAAQTQPRPWTRGSISAASQTPHSPLSAEYLSNPALAEIPSRKFRNSQCSSEGISPAVLLWSNTRTSPTSGGHFAGGTPATKSDATVIHQKNKTTADTTVAANTEHSSPTADTRHLTREVDSVNRIQTTTFRNRPSSTLTTSSSTNSPFITSNKNLSIVASDTEPQKTNCAPKRNIEDPSGSPPLKDTASPSSVNKETSTAEAPALKSRRSGFQVHNPPRDNNSVSVRKAPSKSSIRSAPVKSTTSVPSLDKIPSRKTSKVLTDRNNPNTSTEKNISPSRYHRTSPLTTLNGRMPSATMYSGNRAVTDAFDFGLDGDRTLTTMDRPPPDENKDSSTEETKSRNSDVFLNIAKANGDSTDGGERRRRFRLSGFTSRRTSQAKEATPSPEQYKFRAHHPSPSALHDASPSVQHGTPTLLSPTTVHPFDESNRLRFPMNGASPRSITGHSRSRLGASSREASPETPQVTSDIRTPNYDTRTVRPSALSGARTSRHGSFPAAAERPRFDTDRLRHDGTESTLSTTAPSTVWDELDDLKTRIRNLEQTGKLPSSAMSNASGERPRTANTAMTNISSSPKHIKKTSAPSPDSGMSGSPAPSQVQRLLNSALAKAKGAVTPGVYTVLETAATDALALSSHLGSPPPAGSGASSVNGMGMSDRHAKRKADSLCRSLTELCLVLTEEHATAMAIQPRPLNVDEGASPVVSTPATNGDDMRLFGTRYRRSMSHEPEPRDVTESAPRVSSRLESRRASAATLVTGTGGQRSSQGDRSVPRTPTTNFSTPLTRLSRASTSLHIARQPGEEDRDDRSSVYSNSRPSRAMTEVGGLTIRQRSTTRNRLSGDFSEPPVESSYTRKSLGQPLPLQSQPQSQPQPQPELPSRSVSLTQSGLPLRRSYPATTTSGIPATSVNNFQPGSRRYGVSGLTPSPSTRHMSEPPEETYESPQSQSQTRIAAPPSRLAANYTSIQQPRTRTSSFSTRRLLTRPRLSSSVDPGPTDIDPR